jgi:drug/metabolite transporter (DMT)-like permease
MGLQYTLFTVSLGLTSMTHCLLLNTMCPVIFLAIDFISSKPLYKWEVIGVLVSMIGISLVAFDVSSNKSTATWFGDVLSFLTAIAACGYLMLCKYMLSDRNSPLLSFFAPINFVSSLTSYALAVLFDPTQASEFFGWTDLKYLGLVLYLGLVPGFLGMVSLNFLLMHISMILITVFVNLEPLFGSFIGWIFGYEAIPTPLTWLGGAICICGNMAVTLCGSDSQEKDESKYKKIQETSISEL